MRIFTSTPRVRREQRESRKKCGVSCPFPRAERLWVTFCWPASAASEPCSSDLGGRSAICDRPNELGPPLKSMKKACQTWHAFCASGISSTLNSRRSTPLFYLALRTEQEPSWISPRNPGRHTGCTALHTCLQGQIHSADW